MMNGPLADALFLLGIAAFLAAFLAAAVLE